jgi:hypothetical protein
MIVMMKRVMKEKTKTLMTDEYEHNFNEDDDNDDEY